MDFDFERGAHYLLTMDQPGFPREPFEVVYTQMQESFGVDLHWFYPVDKEFYLAVPDEMIGIDFMVEPL